ncbi:MAG: DUF1540 domain-containing protein [Sarcina sp.]
MASLLCNAENCVNNTGGFCVASAITVDGMGAINKGETYCSEFAVNNFANSVKELANTNYVGVLKQSIDFQKYPMKPEIACTAGNCAHNRDTICRAKAVQIYGQSATNNKGTQCNSFELLGEHAISSDYF